MLKSYFASIISVRLTLFWKKGKGTNGIRIREAQKYADPDPVPDPHSPTLKRTSLMMKINVKMHQINQEALVLKKNLLQCSETFILLPF